MAATGLDVALELDLPASIPAGTLTAVFAFGHCYHPHATVTDLTLLVDGVAHQPAAQRMPRRDLETWRRAQGRDPEGRSYRSGFWAVLPIPARPGPGEVLLQASVSVEGGTPQLVELGTIAVIEPATSAPEPARNGPIAVCMATYEPDVTLFAAQIASLRSQSDRHWRCVVSDGGSAPRTLERIAETIGGDPRFELSPAGRRLDPYRNFERALTLAPADAPLIALADQDDRWYPDKLTTLRAALGEAILVYSDLRLVAGSGKVVRESLWQGRRNDWDNLASMLVANTIPGASMLFGRELLQIALPFPTLPGFHYHDHWLALAALAAGTVHFVDRPLYDYVQHDAAVMGDARRSRKRRRRRGAGGSRGLRDAYFGGVIPRQVQAQALLGRAASTLTPRRRRALEWYVAAERSPLAFAWLALRPLRALAGHSETLGGESALARGIIWRWVIGRLAHGAVDARFPDPPSFEQPRLRRWRGGD